MSEHIKSKHEAHKDKPELNVETEHLPDIEKLNQEALEKAAEVPEVDELESRVEKAAKSSEETTIEETQATSNQEFGAYADMKRDTYSRTLGHVRQRLSAPEKVMSKVMHNKVVEPLSEGLGKTVARPSGILGGGVVALTGSTILLYMAKRYGFEYNFLTFFVLLACGFVIGLMGELALRAIGRSRR